MSVVKAATAYRSGWCGTSSHDGCRGTYAGTPCSCTCHLPAPARTCLCCGQALPEEVPRG